MINSKFKFTAFLLLFVLIFFRSTNTICGSFEEALQSASDQNKILIVDVYTDWCGWCKKMDKDTYANSGVKKMLYKDFICVKLDAEGSESNKYKGKTYTSSELAAFFGITAYPTTVFLKPDGTIIGFNYNKSKMTALPGYYGASDFKKILEYFKNEDYLSVDMSTIF